MKKVIGIGGVFFKCKDPKKMISWYEKHLGFLINPYGAVFEIDASSKNKEKFQTQWSPFPETTDYFEPSTKDFMINYQVADLEAFYKDLNAEGVTILGGIQTFDYGKFLHNLDIEGNRIELWEPA